LLSLHAQQKVTLAFSNTANRDMNSSCPQNPESLTCALPLATLSDEQF
jgi:hypothetical protein